jgi:hypothetical protein
MTLTPTAELVLDIAQLLLLCALAGIPGLVVSVLARRSEPVRRQHRRVAARRMSAEAVAAADAAAASVLQEPTQLAGISLPCRECGGESPPVPIQRTAVTSVGAGYVVVATCRACHNPLVSRVLTAEKAAELIDAGAVNELEVLGRFRRELLDL